MKRTYSVLSLLVSVLRTIHYLKPNAKGKTRESDGHFNFDLSVKVQPTPSAVRRNLASFTESFCLV